MLAEDDPVKMEMDIVDEQLDTTARTFMGLTVGCARCHDHKFDPIPQADYYSMAGIFKSTKTMENFKVVAKWHEYVLAPKEDLDRLKAHEDKIKAKQSEISRITKADNTKLVAEAREKAGAYLLAADDVLRYERIRLKPIMGGSRNSSGAVIRDASSFDLGNVPRKLEKENANVPKDQTGSCFAEYVITLPSKGDYQIDILEQEAGHGTPDILVNGVLMRKGAPPVQNRAASPDAGGWSVAGIFPFNAGRNTIRLEQKTRFSYFEKLLAAPSPLAAGETEPKTLAQVARRFGVNPGFLEQWVEEMGRSKGAPHSILFAWFAFGDDELFPTPIPPDISATARLRSIRAREPRDRSLLSRRSTDR